MDQAIAAVAEIILNLTDKGKESLRRDGLSYLSGDEFDKCKSIVKAVRAADAEREYGDREMQQLDADGQL